MRWMLLVLLLGCSSVPGAAGGDDDSGGSDGGGGTDGRPSTAGGVFDPLVTQVVFEIDYEQGQEPYTGPIVGFGDTFDVMVVNTNRLFAGSKTVVIPRALGDMSNIGAVADEELTVSDLLALADAHREERDRTGTKTYYVVFVSGHFADASGPQANVLGVSLGNTGVIAMFKDVIRSTDLIAFPNVVRYVEQSTLVHEGAHAIGLVDNGVALASPHVDTAHGKHCTNDRCVMYWLNEGANDAVQFARMNVVSGDTILFDAACLADVDALTGGPP